jgi:hypothetical protein
LVPKFSPLQADWYHQSPYSHNSKAGGKPAVKHAFLIKYVKNPWTNIHQLGVCGGG